MVVKKVHVRGCHTIDCCEGKIGYVYETLAKPSSIKDGLICFPVPLPELRIRLISLESTV
ncbi:MAG: hypothetical protein GHCLOJNM_04475 [bacterium]|nr:hypothetical protein [bacterium]